jgi:methylmalonyl-CoA/ethylmalonyl-CoA epimerase
MATEPKRGLLEGRALTQVALTTRDLDQARQFYGEVLGLKLLFEAGQMLFFQLEGLRLMIGLSPDQPIGGSILYFDAPDIHTLGAALEARGVGFLGPAAAVQRTEAQELLLRVFRDPDGNPLALMGWTERPA